MTTTEPSHTEALPESLGDGSLTHRQIMTILTGLGLGMFLAALDSNIVATAIRSIGDDLHGLKVQAWVTTAFLITSTITTPLYGKLSDIYGRKPLFLTAITIFVTGSALCGLATSMYMLAAFRAFQGLGAGGLLSMAMAILADILSPKERPKYQGYFVALFASASVIGPVVGGFLAGQASLLGVTGWRWIFWVNVPIGLVALVVVNRVLKLPTKRAQIPIDWFGSLALVVGLVPLLIVAEQGNSWGWTSPLALGCYALGVIGFGSFVVFEHRMGDAALIPMRLYKGKTFSVGTAQSFIMGIGLFGGVACIPLYLQIVKGASPTRAGLLILPMVLGLMSASMVAGRLTSRTGRYKHWPIIGACLLITGLLLFATVQADTPIWHTDIYMLCFGVGLGFSMQTVQMAMQNVAEPRDIGVVTASATFFRQLGGTLGTAVLLSILFSLAPRKIAAAYQGAQSNADFKAAAAAHPDQLKAVTNASGSLNDTSFLYHMEKVLAHPFLVGFSQAMDVVFLVAAGTMVGALILSLMLPEAPLRKLSGLQMAHAESTAAQVEELAEMAARSLPGAPELPASVEATPSASGTARG